MATPIFEKLKQEKAQESEARYALLKTYTEALKAIKVPKFTRALYITWYIILRVICISIAFAAVLAFLYSLYSDYILETWIKPVTPNEKLIVLEVNKYAGFGLLGVAVLFIWISFLVKRISGKNRTIAKFSALISKMIDEEKKNIENEKQTFDNLMAAMDGDKDKMENDAYLN